MFGSLIGGVITTLLILLYSLPAAVAFVVAVLIWQQISSNIISPRIQSKRMNTSPLLVLVSATVGIMMGGLLGAFVAIPIAGCLVILARDYLHTRKLKFAADDGEMVELEGPDVAEISVAAVFTEPVAHDTYVTRHLKKTNARRHRQNSNPQK
jgi:uncharacterized membrane protein YfcA